MTAHHCHALDCSRPCTPRMLMCGPCWSRVKKDTQREVYRTVKLRDMDGCDHTWAPWWRAQARAIAENAVARGVRSEEWADEYMKREKRIAKKLELRVG